MLGTTIQRAAICITAPVCRLHPSAPTNGKSVATESGRRGKVNSIHLAKLPNTGRAGRRLLSSTAEGKAILDRVNALVNFQGNSNNILPNDFFSVPLPQNFWGMNPSSFDITTLNGYNCSACGRFTTQILEPCINLANRDTFSSA